MISTRRGRAGRRRRRRSGGAGVRRGRRRGSRSRRRTFGLAAATCARAMWSWGRASGSGRRSSRRSPRPVWRASGARGRRAPPCSPPGASWASRRPPRPGEIYESNSLLISAQLELSGSEAIVFPVVADDEAATRAVLERALEEDVVITTGGVSVGPHDLVRATLQSRRRGGVLARRGEAGQADRVRGSGRHADLRTARQPRLVPCRMRAVRSSGAARVQGARIPARVPSRPARRRGAQQSRA